MNNKFLYQTLVVLLMVLTFCLQNDSFIADGMESRNLATAREMLEKGNWFAPTMNGEYRFEKPPLPTWAAAFAMHIASQDNMMALRLPAALSGMLLIYFLFRLSRELTTDDLLPYLAAGIASTSYLIMFASRIITWDIFCHSFMLGAIWQLHVGLTASQYHFKHFVASGLLMGLSFLSKGPIAFFVLLLPYLIARFFAYPDHGLKTNLKPLLILAAITLAISSAWPLYIYSHFPDVSQYVANKESDAWINRHTKPFYYYWNFPLQSGVWAFLATTSLIAPYARKRVEEFGNYKFLLFWVAGAVILMSLFPEKKSRYLLPVMLPLAILTACYLRYLIKAYQESRFTKHDTLLFSINNLLIATASLVAPFLLWKLFAKNGFDTPLSFKIISITICWTLSLALIRFTWTKQPLAAWISVVIWVASTSLWLMGEAPKLLISNPGFRPYEALRHLEETRSLPFYSDSDLGGKFIEVVWGSGKEIHGWNPNETPELPSTPPLVFFSNNASLASLPNSILEQYDIQDLGLFDTNFRAGTYTVLKNHVMVIRSKRPSSLTP